MPIEAVELVAHRVGADTHLQHGALGERAQQPELGGHAPALGRVDLPFAHRDHAPLHVLIDRAAVFEAVGGRGLGLEAVHDRAAAQQHHQVVALFRVLQARLERHVAQLVAGAEHQHGGVVGGDAVGVRQPRLQVGVRGQVVLLALRLISWPQPWSLR
jgi:hypothetical protein